MNEICECCGNLIPSLPPIMKDDQYAFSVIIQENGTVKNVQLISQGISFYQDSWEPVCLVEIHKNPNDRGVIFRLFAINSEQAVKLADKGRGNLLATGKWTTNWHLWRDKITSGEYVFPTKFR